MTVPNQDRAQPRHEAQPADLVHTPPTGSPPSTPCTAVKKRTPETPPAEKKADPLAVPSPSESALLELDALRAMLGAKTPKAQAEQEPPDGQHP